VYSSLHSFDGMIFLFFVKIIIVTRRSHSFKFVFIAKCIFLTLLDKMGMEFVERVEFRFLAMRTGAFLVDKLL